MDLTIIKKTNLLNDTPDSVENLIKSLFTKKKYFFIYDGVKFISDKEIIGVDPKTYKLIYKNNN